MTPRSALPFVVVAVVAAVLTAVATGLLLRADYVEATEEHLLRQAGLVASAFEGGGFETRDELNAALERQGTIMIGPFGAGRRNAILDSAVATGRESGAIEVEGQAYAFALAQTAPGPVVLVRETGALPPAWWSFAPRLLAATVVGALLGSLVAWAVGSGGEERDRGAVGD